MVFAPATSFSDDNEWITLIKLILPMAVNGIWLTFCFRNNSRSKSYQFFFFWKFVKPDSLGTNLTLLKKNIFPSLSSQLIITRLKFWHVIRKFKLFYTRHIMYVPTKHSQALSTLNFLKTKCLYHLFRLLQHCIL